MTTNGDLSLFWRTACLGRGNTAPVAEIPADIEPVEAVEPVEAAVVERAYCLACRREIITESGYLCPQCVARLV